MSNYRDMRLAILMVASINIKGALSRYLANL